jgi:hypothetical protein
MKIPTPDDQYHELLNQACDAMLEAAKVRDRSDLTESEKHERWKELTRQSVKLHNQAVACWNKIHGSREMTTLSDSDPSI